MDFSQYTERQLIRMMINAVRDAKGLPLIGMPAQEDSGKGNQITPEFQKQLLCLLENVPGMGPKMLDKIEAAMEEWRLR